jgi:phosphoglycerate dehydrogenase-like enzyme
VRFVQRCGVGYDNLDLPALAAAGVQAAYTPGANAGAVAEHAILLMLALLKRLPAADAATRRGEWPAQALVQAGLGDLAAATIGLIGFGHIGQAVAARVRPFGSRLLYTARHPLDREQDERLGVEYVPLSELLARATIVSLHVPLAAETRHLIGAQELARMQPGALLINTSRGAVLDEAALRQALEEGRLGGAGLDVLVDERPGGNPFADLPQVVVTPHVASASRAGIGSISERAVANVARYLAGKPVLDLVPQR